MTCAEFKELAGALALGALEPAEEAACADHLDTAPVHQGCHEAYARARVTAGRLATSLTPVRPGAHVWKGIEAALEGESRSARPRRWTAMAGWAVAAAAAIAVVFLWLDRDRSVRLLIDQKADAINLASVAQQQQRKCEEELNAVREQLDVAKDGDQLARDAVALADRPGTRLIPMEGKGYHATIVYNPAARRAYVVAATLEPLSGQDFELWVIRDAKTPPISAGLMQTRQGQVAIGEVRPDVLSGGGVGAFAMSLEPKGGSPTGKPTTVLMAGPVKG